MSKRTFATLDALRGLAAFAVVLGHLRDHFPPRVFDGTHAVDVFFIMSGFVVAHAYEQRLSSGMSLSAFTALRAVRLYPLYAAGTALGALALWVSPPRTIGVPDSSALFWATLMLPAPGGRELFPLNPVAWSLFFEIVINVLYALTWRAWTVRNLCWAVSIAALALLGARVGFQTFSMGFAWDNALGGLARIAYGFPLGVLLFRLWATGRLSLKLPPGAVLGVAVLCFVDASPMGLAGPTGLVGKALQAGVVFILAPAVIAAAVQAEPGPALRPVFLAVGNLSYAVYALHLPLIWLLMGADYGGSAWQPRHWDVLMLAAVTALCWLAHHVYDVPVRSYLSRKLHGPATHNRAAALS